jgi:DNA-binding PadR family transcriptional regulator
MFKHDFFGLRHDLTRFRHGMRRFRRGMLKFVVLSLLQERPRHGYDLLQALRERGFSVSQGAIYTVLSALEEAGLIVGREEGDRRIYEMSERGKRFTADRADAAAEASRFFEDTGFESEQNAQTQGGLRDAAGRLMQAVAQLGPTSKPETIERVRELLDRARREIYTLLAQE